MKHSKTVAWGEIGLDYHVFEKENYAKPELQRRIFVDQMKHALQLKKPIVIHTREAEEETLSMMKSHLPRDWKIHVHCFTDSLPFAKRLLSEFDNLYIGFTGVITFKNSEVLQNVVKEIPLEKMLLETGSNLSVYSIEAILSWMITNNCLSRWVRLIQKLLLSLELVSVIFVLIYSCSWSPFMAPIPYRGKVCVLIETWKTSKFII